MNKDNKNTQINTAEQSKPAEKANKSGKGGVKAFMKSRKTKHGTAAVIIVAVVLAAVIVLNIVCSLLVDRFPALSFDLTANQVYGLQDDTKDYITHLEKDITIYPLSTEDKFTSNGEYFVQADKFLKSMESLSGHVKVKYTDLTQNPTFTTAYENIDLTQTNYVFLVECGENYRVLTIDDCFEYDQQSYYYYGSYSFTGSKVEQALVTAILNVTTDDKPIVDFITGNSEVDSKGFKNLLESNAYQINEVSLTTSQLEDDATVAVLFAPAVDLDLSAVEKIETWLENGGDYGKSLIYVANYNVQDTPNIDSLLEKWGMKMSNGLLFETDRNFLVTNNPFISLTDYNEVFTEGLKNSSIPCVSSFTRGIDITDEEKATPMLKSSSSSCILPYSEQENTDWDYKSAITGEPLNAAVKSTRKNTDEVASNVLVFGSYEMFSESVLAYNSYNNSAFFVNAVNTLADRDNVGITIEGKSMDSATLGIDVGTQAVLMVLLVILIPLAVLAAGLVIWIRRRNR